MIVSGKLDDVAVMFRKKCNPVAVQFDKNDTGEAEPPDFTTFPQELVARQVQGTLRGVEDTLFKGVGVPVRAPNPEGAANFWSPMPFFVPMLDIESPVPLPASAYDDRLISKFPDVPVQYPYDKGIRAGSRPINFDDISEDTAMMFRKGRSRQVAYAPATTNYDIGAEDLRQLTKKNF